MSIYSELLRLALAHSRDSYEDDDIETLVARLLERRAQLEKMRIELPPTESRAVEWTAALIAHDVALVELCDHLGVSQSLAEAAALPTERDRLLTAIAERVNLERLEPFSTELRSS